MKDEVQKTKINTKKSAIVTEVSNAFSKSKAFFLADYKGLTHKQLEDLRRSLKKVEAQFTIVKNTLLKKSLEQIKDKNKDSFDEHLKAETAAMFAFADPLLAVKALSDFAKSTKLPKVKIGLMDGSMITADDFKRLALLPTRDVLLATLVYRLKSPISGLHYALNWNLQKFVIALNNIKDKKPLSS